MQILVISQCYFAEEGFHMYIHMLVLSYFSAPRSFASLPPHCSCCHSFLTVYNINTDYFKQNSTPLQILSCVAYFSLSFFSSAFLAPYISSISNCRRYDSSEAKKKWNIEKFTTSFLFHTLLVTGQCILSCRVITDLLTSTVIYHYQCSVSFII